MIVYAVVAITVFVIFVCKWLFSLQNKPDGFTGLPIVGYYPFLGSNQMQTILRLADKSGDIMRMDILGSQYYFLNTFPLIKEAMVSQGDNFTARPLDEFNLYTFTFGKNSVINSEGDMWQTHQKFMVRSMSGLGMGKSALEPKIHQICDALIENVRKTEGKCFDFMEILTNFTSNVISMFLHGEFYDIDDPVYCSLRDNVHDFYLSVRDFDAFLTGKMFHLIMRLRHTSYKRLQNVRQRFGKYVDTIVKNRLNQFDPKTCNDLLDLYLSKYISEENDNNKDKKFDLETLKGNWFMMFIVGTDTSSTSLYHAMCLMILYPQIQWKVQQEIDDVIGKYELVSMAHKNRLNYTQAVFAEIYRYSCVVPFGMYHLNFKETTIGGYKIPKRSKVIANFWKVSRDKTYFKFPTSFDPRNFLDENENFVNNEANIPFLIGRRMCLGSSLANAELFIAFVTLLQKFEWQPSSEEPVEYHVYDSVVRPLKSFKARAVPRY